MAMAGVGCENGEPSLCVPFAPVSAHARAYQGSSLLRTSPLWAWCAQKSPRRRFASRNAPPAPAACVPGVFENICARTPRCWPTTIPPAEVPKGDFSQRGGMLSTRYLATGDIGGGGVSRQPACARGLWSVAVQPQSLSIGARCLEAPTTAAVVGLERRNQNLVKIRPSDHGQLRCEASLFQRVLEAGFAATRGV